MRTQFTYDSQNRLIQVAWFVSGVPWKTTSYSYDTNDRRTAMTDPENVGYAYTYDNADRLTSVVRAGIAAASFTYDSGGRRKTLTYGNGVTTTYGYDLQGRLTGLETKNTSGATLAQFAYTYNKIDNRTQVHLDHLNVRADYAYNGVSWLTEETWSGAGAGAVVPPYQAAYDYDLSGNRTLLTPTHNLHRPQGDAIEDFGYDYANRLVSYKRTEGGQLTQHWSYLYAPTGERLNKRNELTGETQWYMYDGSDVIADYQDLRRPQPPLLPPTLTPWALTQRSHASSPQSLLSSTSPMLQARCIESSIKSSR